MDNFVNDIRDFKLDDNNVLIGFVFFLVGVDFFIMFFGLLVGYKVNIGMMFEEMIVDLNKYLLFMIELDDVEENEEFVVLQFFVYDGMFLENGFNFKEQGNECFKVKKWVDVKEFYGKGVQILQVEEFRWSKGIKKKVQKQQEVVMRSEEEQKVFEEREKKRLVGNDGLGVVKEDEKIVIKEEYEEVEDDFEEM